MEDEIVKILINNGIIKDIAKIIYRYIDDEEWKFCSRAVEQYCLLWNIKVIRKNDILQFYPDFQLHFAKRGLQICNEFTFEICILNSKVIKII